MAENARDPDLVRGLADVGAEDWPAAGGKGASLGELWRAGVRVPAGYVVTTAAFERFLQALDPGGEIRRAIGRLAPDDVAAIARVTARVRAAIAAARMPPEVAAAIEGCYQALGNEPGAASGPDASSADTSGAVAVRSSATGEDSADASFAGLQDTYLWVRGAPAVISQVRNCWASLYNAESVSYRLRLKIPERAATMGVVIQRMVSPRCAGVMFTRSPATGDRSLVAIEGTWGLGSALVSGDVTPDGYVVSKVTGDILKRTVSVKLRWHTMMPNGSGVAVDDMPEHLREQACLSDSDIDRLLRLARRVESHYGAPRDIEWAIVDGAPPGENLVLLQSRPETVWSKRDAAPVAVPMPRPFDHVITYFTGGPR